MVEQKLRDRKKFMAAIHTFNEEKYIGTIVLKTRQHIEEVVVVDDGSIDGTAAVARLAGATVIQHKHNKGYGASIQPAYSRGKAKRG